MEILMRENDDCNLINYFIVFGLSKNSFFFLEREICFHNITMHFPLKSACHSVVQQCLLSIQAYYYPTNCFQQQCILVKESTDLPYIGIIHSMKCRRQLVGTGRGFIDLQYQCELLRFPERWSDYKATEQKSTQYIQTQLQIGYDCVFLACSQKTIG